MPALSKQDKIAKAHLAKKARRFDAGLRDVLKADPLLAMPARPRDRLLLVLARAIVGQQLSTKVARVFWTRLEDGAAALDLPMEGLFHEAHEERLRGIGLSRSKVSFLFSLHEAHKDGQLKPAKIKRAPHEERIKILTQIHGIGRWTADMIGIFYCLDPDIWPDGDLAVRQTFAQLTGKAEKQTEALAAEFSPYRSYLALHMWRARNMGYNGGREVKSKGEKR